MGLYIPNMQMPTGGRILIVFPSGRVLEVSADETQDIFREAKAFPVPPHGDSIDRAALLVKINKICDRRDAGIISDLTCLQQITSALRHASTIIPAEPAEEGQ
jgi:hypothetical protein